jgi:hypothetical protein
MATFAKEYLGKQCRPGLAGDVEIKHPDDSLGVQVLCASTDELRRAVRLGIGIPEIPVIYIPREESATVTTELDFIEELRGWGHKHRVSGILKVHAG